MELYDISRDFFRTKGYPGDPPPRVERLCRMETGEPYNLSAYFACSHTATHVDAPLHYVQQGASIEKLPLRPFYGPCTVITVQGILTGEEMDALLPLCERRVLFRGNGGAFLSQSAAFALADAGVFLVGTDALSIGCSEEGEGPHKELLLAGVPILEGLDLSAAPDGNYILSAFPIRLDGLEGAPVRAVLIRP